MKPGFVLIALVSLAALAVLVGCGEKSVDEDYRQSIDDWHAGRIERLEAPDGWLSLVGLHPLPEGTSTVGTDDDRDIRLNAYAPLRVGSFTVAPDSIVFTPDPEAPVMIGGKPIAGPVTVETDAAGAPTVIQVATVSFHVIERGDRNFLRVKDSSSEARLRFEGIERFPVDPAWRVVARLQTSGMPPTVPITNVLGQVAQEPSPGVLVFELEGRRQRLIPVGEAGEPLFIVFGDRTNGDETYGGGRFLGTDPPDSAGNVVLDFNKATNPPCAFTPYATCPMPPPENVLPVRVTAGEKAWEGHH